jgi:hypothetical protein
MTESLLLALDAADAWFAHRLLDLILLAPAPPATFRAAGHRKIDPLQALRHD